MASNRSGELPTARRSKTPPKGDEPSSFVVSVVEGPDAGLSFTLDGASPTRALLGTSPLCSLRLSDREVSRRHVSIRPTAEALEVMDLGSTNGTTVNGVAIREALLRGGEALRVGRTVLSVTRGDPTFASLTRESAFGDLLGESRAMRKLYPVLTRLARSEDPVLLEGEAGTGKELCAEQLHARSARESAPFAVLDTTMLRGSEMAPRLFGNESADGALFVDEIGDLPLDVQARLLSVLRSGAPGPRFLFATSRDLDRDVADGRFDEALLLQLAPTRVELPALRDRAGDVPLLARHFWRTLRTSAEDNDEPELPDDFLSRFEHYPWPGNVRELRSAVEARMRLGQLGTWQFDRSRPAGADFIAAVVDQNVSFSRARQVVIEEFERQYVESVLAAHGGNVTQAAKASGLALRYFQLIRARRSK